MVASAISTLPPRLRLPSSSSEPRSTPDSSRRPLTKSSAPPRMRCRRSRASTPSSASRTPPRSGGWASSRTMLAPCSSMPSAKPGPSSRLAGERVERRDRREPGLRAGQGEAARARSVARRARSSSAGLHVPARSRSSARRTPSSRSEPKIGPPVSKAIGRSRASTRSTCKRGPRLGGPGRQRFREQPQPEAGRDLEPADRDRPAEGLLETGLRLAPQTLRRELPRQREADGERRGKGQRGESPSQAHASHSAPRRPRGSGARRRAVPGLPARCRLPTPTLGSAEPARTGVRRGHPQAPAALVAGRGPTHPSNAKVASSLKNSRVRSKRHPS